MLRRIVLATIAAALVACHAAAECPAAPQVTVSSMSRVDFYTTLTTSMEVTLIGCNLKQEGIHVTIGGIACEQPKTTNAWLRDDPESTLTCSLPAGPLTQKTTNDVIVLAADGTALLTLAAAVEFHTPTLSHVLPLTVANSGPTVRLGVSGLVHRDDPLARYTFTLAGLDAPASAIGRYYANVRAGTIADDAPSKAGAVVVVDKLTKETVIDTADQRFTIEKRAAYINSVAPSWAFAALAEPVTLEISVRGLGKVLSVSASGVPCTDVQTPSPMTVRCALQPCPDAAACVGARPEGLVVTHVPDDAAPDAPPLTVSWYWQYIAVPVASPSLLPMQTFPHNLAHRVTVHFTDNSLDASVPIKLYVGDESVCSCAITHPWALHFLLDPTAKEGTLPLSFMLTNGVVRGYNVPGGITFGPAVTAPGITLLSPQTLPATAPDAEFAVFGFGFAPVERLAANANATAADRCDPDPDAAGSVRPISAAAAAHDDGDVPPVSSFRLSSVLYLDRDGVATLRDVPLQLTPGPFGEPGKITVNGTRVRAADCARGAAPVGCVAGRYRVVGLDDKGAAVTTPAPNGEGGALAADEVEISGPQWAGDSVSLSAILKLRYAPEAADKAREGFWRVLDDAAAKQKYGARVIFYGIEQENEKESTLTAIFLPRVKKSAVEEEAEADKDEPTAQELADAFAEEFLSGEGPFAEAVAPVVDYRTVDVEFCSDATFQSECHPTKLKPWMIAAICGGIGALLLIIITALCCKCRKKRSAPVAITQINSSDDVYHRITGPGH